MDGEDDYLSDKFLFETTTTQPSSTSTKTYSERRKDAQKKSQLKSEANRRKSRKQLQEESIQEGLSTSLFQRAQAEQAELGTENKAMSMMKKMGFQLGQSLGRKEEEAPLVKPQEDNTPSPSPGPPSTSANLSTEQGRAEQQHRKVPISIDLWEGKKGVGLGKRAVSPSAVDRIAKAAKIVEETSKETYRIRARDEYTERRAEARIQPATRTLITLDEKAGIDFNILSLNPHDLETIPPELLSALETYVTAGFGGEATSTNGKETEAERVKRQMQLDALQPLVHHGPDGYDDVPEKKSTEASRVFSEEEIQSANEFLVLNAQDRLARVTMHLRRHYFYCFWCGTQYGDEQDLAENCPGEDEEAHD